jgi:hypothetical protein
MNELLGWYGYEKVNSSDTEHLNLERYTSANQIFILSTLVYIYTIQCYLKRGLLRIFQNSFSWGWTSADDKHTPSFTYGKEFSFFIFFYAS